MRTWVLLALAAAGVLALAVLSFGAHTRVVYRAQPDPATQHSTAGLVAADVEWWNAQEKLDAKTARYPTWLLGYRVERGTAAFAAVDDFIAGVATGGHQSFFSSVTVQFRWSGSRWVQQGPLSIQTLGSTPAAYAQFTPLP